MSKRHNIIHNIQTRKKDIFRVSQKDTGILGLICSKIIIKNVPSKIPFKNNFVSMLQKPVS